MGYLNPFGENFFGIKLLELLGNLLKDLFIPSQERLESINNAVSVKFSFVTTIKQAINSTQEMLNGLESAPRLQLEVGSTKWTEKQTLTILDLSFYKTFKPFGDLVITGFCYLAFIWKMLFTLPSFINGTAGGVSGLNEITRIVEKGGGIKK